MTDIHREDEFNNLSLIDALEPVSFHVYDKVEHVGFIKNRDENCKRKKRELFNSVSYTRYNVFITRAVVDMEAEMINIFPSENGISKKLSPATIF